MSEDIAIAIWVFNAFMAGVILSPFVYKLIGVVVDPLLRWFEGIKKRPR